MAAGTEPPTGPPTLEARLGLLDATTLVAGSMIGSGIFIVSADIARRLPAPGWLLAVWAIAGVLTVAGALSYGRLAAAMPRAGGQYVYLTALYGPRWGFLFGWTLVLVIQNVTFTAGEVRDPRRTVPRALLLGTAVVCVLYFLTNVAYLNVLPLTGIAHATADRVGTAAMARIAGGGAGTTFMAIAVMVSTFG